MDGMQGIGVMVIWMVVIFGLMYFLTIRPQNKKDKEHKALVNSIEDGDCVLTSSGFYGVVISVSEEVIIVEFGNNKNCRIPMRKDAVVEVEKRNE